MKPGINHEPSGAEQFILQTPEIAERIIPIRAKFGHKLLAVQRPAFLKRVETGDTDEERCLAKCRRNRALGMVPRNAFMKAKRWKAETRHRTHIAQVDPISSGPGAIK